MEVKRMGAIDINHPTFLASKMCECVGLYMSACMYVSRMERKDKN